MTEFIKVFEYASDEIAFKTDNDLLMVNATDMAKAFGKRTSDFLSNKQTNELINCISAETGIPATELVVVNQGGSTQGTWMHEDVALVFAQWLSPAFYLWCNARIKELLIKGNTSLVIPNFSNPAEAARAWADQYECRQLAEKQLEIQAPKVDYYDKALSSESLFTTNSIALCLGVSARALNDKLKVLGIQYKQGGVWLVTAKYRDKGLSKVINVPIVKDDGEVISQPQMKWTERGKEFILNLRDNGKL